MNAFQRKLSSPEYKDVDEEYRVAMIKYETTQMAVKDLDKYHAALDKVSTNVLKGLCGTSLIHLWYTCAELEGTLEISWCKNRRDQ